MNASNPTRSSAPSLMLISSRGSEIEVFSTTHKLARGGTVTNPRTEVFGLATVHVLLGSHIGDAEDALYALLDKLVDAINADPARAAEKFDAVDIELQDEFIDMDSFRLVYPGDYIGHLPWKGQIAPDGPCDDEPTLSAAQRNPSLVSRW